MGQNPIILVNENNSGNVNYTILQSTDGKRCILLNILCQTKAPNDLLKENKILITLKVFYDSAKASTLFTIIPKDSLNSRHSISDETLANQWQKELMQQWQQAMADSGTGYQSQYPWVMTSTARELVIEKDNLLYRISDNSIYIQAFLIQEFNTRHYRQSGMNIINTKAVIWTPSNIYQQIPGDLYNMGRCLLTGKYSDSTYHFIRIPPVTDDNELNQYPDEFDYKPGFGITAFKSYYRSTLPLQRINPGEHSRLMEKYKHCIPWKSDMLYSFHPSPNETSGILLYSELHFDEGTNSKKMKIHQPASSN